MRRLFLTYAALFAALLASWQCFAQLTTSNVGGGGFGGAAAGVTFDVGSAFAQAVTASVFNYSTGVTVSGSASLVVAYVSTINLNTITSVVWDSGNTNQTMTPIGSMVLLNAGAGSLGIWCVTSPTAGTNQTLQVNSTGTTDRLTVAMSSWIGTNAVVGTACQNFSSAKTAGGGNTDITLSTTVTSASGHMVTGMGIDTQSGNTISMNGTSISSINAAPSETAANRQSGAGSVTVTFNDSTPANIGVLGIDISP